MRSAGRIDDGHRNLLTNNFYFSNPRSSSVEGHWKQGKLRFVFLPLPHLDNSLAPLTKTISMGCLSARLEYFAWSAFLSVFGLRWLVLVFCVVARRHADRKIAMRRVCKRH